VGRRRTAPPYFVFATLGELVFLFPVQRVEQGAIRVFAKCWRRRHEEVHEPSGPIGPLIDRRRGAIQVAADEKNPIESISVLDVKDCQPGARIF